MSILNNILLLNDIQTGPHSVDAVHSTYAQGYGNRVASAKAFAPLGHARHTEQLTHGAPARRFAVSAPDPCPLRACG